MQQINPLFKNAMQMLWRQRFPHAPWLMRCWEDAWQAMQAGDDFVVYAEGAADAAQLPPWGEAQALTEDLPIWQLTFAESLALNQQGDFPQQWRQKGSPPWVLVVDERVPRARYRLYTAATFADECAINAWLFGRSHSPSQATRSLTATPATPATAHMPPSWVWQADQQAALTAAAVAELLILTGGPGSGKTTVLTQILANALAAGIAATDIAIAAPSGKAAERMNAALHDRGIHGLAAGTVDRLLGLGFGGQAQFHALRPLPYRLIVVDECSMINVRRFAQLFRALPASLPPTQLILCGDPHQLAAVEHGEVFRRLADLGGLATGKVVNPSIHWVHVQGNQRARHPALIQCAEHIQAGDAAAWHDWWATLPAGAAATAGVFRLLPEQDVLDQANQALHGLIENYLAHLAALIAAPADHPAHIPQALGAWWHDHRLLCAQKVGAGGTHALNRRARAQIKAWLNTNLPMQALSLPDHDETMPLMDGGVVQLQRNLPALGLNNGATGIIWQGRVWFPTRRSAAAQAGGEEPWQAHSAALLHDCEWGFAITVHKSQGSEFKHVWLVIPPKSRVLSREVLYTGATRAQISLTLFAAADTLTHAINHPERRQCGIEWVG